MALGRRCNLSSILVCFARWQRVAFFRATLDNMEMVLAKSDMAIAKRYATLVQDPSLAGSLFGKIRASWDATHDCLLAITEQSRLLEKSPRLDASIRLRCFLYRAAQPSAGRAAEAL